MGPAAEGSVVTGSRRKLGRETCRPPGRQGEGGGRGKGGGEGGEAGHPKWAPYLLDTKRQLLTVASWSTSTEVALGGTSKCPPPHPQAGTTASPAQHPTPPHIWSHTCSKNVALPAICCMIE